MRRHSLEEIGAKLSEAEALAAKGQTQKQIAKKLGICVMTFHRWRNGRNLTTNGKAAQLLQARTITQSSAERSEIQALKIENARLRNLIADLLLDKVRLGPKLHLA
jgi:putative transposase